MRSYTASEIRRLARKIVQLDRRLALASLPGKVKPGSQDYEQRVLRLVIGTTSDGKDILSPLTRWNEPGAGNLKIHSPPADNEQMTLDSPSGAVGTGSQAKWATYDDDNRSPSQSGEEHVIEFMGKARITLKADLIRLDLAGESLVEMTPDGIDLVGKRIRENP